MVVLVVVAPKGVCLPTFRSLHSIRHLNNFEAKEAVLGSQVSGLRILALLDNLESGCVKWAEDFNFKQDIYLSGESDRFVFTHQSLSSNESIKPRSSAVAPIYEAMKGNQKGEKNLTNPNKPKQTQTKRYWRVTSAGENLIWRVTSEGENLIWKENLIIRPFIHAW